MNIRYCFAMLALLPITAQAHPTQHQANCLAKNIYHEARGQSIKGQIAVAAVTLNRAHAQHKTICEIVYQHAQFSWTDQNLPKPRPGHVWRNIRVLAVHLIRQRYTDPTHGADHYHTVTSNPRWARSTRMKFTVRIGAHMFYKEVPRKQPNNLVAQL